MEPISTPFKLSYGLFLRFRYILSFSLAKGLDMQLILREKRLINNFRSSENRFEISTFFDSILILLKIIHRNFFSRRFRIVRKCHLLTVHHINNSIGLQTSLVDLLNQSKIIQENLDLDDSSTLCCQMPWPQQDSVKSDVLNSTSSDDVDGS